MLKLYSRYIDKVSQTIGNVVCYLTLACIAVVLYEVFMRFVISESQVWTTEMTAFLLGPLFALAGPYTLLNKGHVAMDLFYRTWSPRVQAIVDIVTFVFVIIFLGVLLWKGSDFALKSIQLNQRSPSAWGPPLWPLKIIIPIGAFLMLLQAFSELFKKVLVLIEGGNPE